MMDRFLSELSLMKLILSIAATNHSMLPLAISLSNSNHIFICLFLDQNIVVNSQIPKWSKIALIAMLNVHPCAAATSDRRLFCYDRGTPWYPNGAPVCDGSFCFLKVGQLWGRIKDKVDLKIKVKVKCQK